MPLLLGKGKGASIESRYASWSVDEHAVMGTHASVPACKSFRIHQGVARSEGYQDQAVLNDVMHTLRTRSNLSWSMAKHPAQLTLFYVSIGPRSRATGDMSTMMEEARNFS